MPNHVTNRIKFLGDQEGIDKVLQLIKSDYKCVCRASMRVSRVR